METKERKAGMAGRLELVEGMRLGAIGARKREMEFGLEDARMDFCDFFDWCAEWMYESQMVVDYLEELGAFPLWEGAEELADDLRGRVGMIELDLVEEPAGVEAPQAAPTGLRGSGSVGAVLRAAQAGMVDNGWRAIRRILLVLADVLSREDPELDEREKRVLFRTSGQDACYKQGPRILLREAGLDGSDRPDLEETERKLDF